MSKIVAFSVPSIEDGQKALEELESAEEVKDVALVYKNAKGHVKVQQTSDVTAGKGALRGGVLGAAVSLFAGPLIPVAAAGAVGGAAIAALGDRGVDNKVMKLASEQLEAGNAAVFVLAGDAEADRIEAKVRELSHLKQFDGVIQVGEFSEDAQDLVKEHIKAEQHGAI